MNTTTADLLRSAPGSPVVVLDGESTEEGDVGSKLVRRDLGNTSQSGEVHVLDKRRNSPYQPSGWYLKRTDAPDELKFVSTGPGQDARLVEDYVYDSVGGAGITVFVLDSGANKDNPYLKNMPGGSSDSLFLKARPNRTQGAWSSSFRIRKAFGRKPREAMTG